MPSQLRESGRRNSFVSSSASDENKGHLSSAVFSAEGAPPLANPIDKSSRGIGFSGLVSVFGRDKLDPDAIATQPSVFDDPCMLEAYQPPPKYENAHRFDRLARWTWREEKALVRKIDFRIMIWAIVMFLSLDLDRSNISQANSDTFFDDLGLTTNDYNLGNSLFRLSFLSAGILGSFATAQLLTFYAELPSQLISKRLGPDVWVPSQMVMWSIVSASQFWLNGRSSFLACRFLLGFLQGGFIPDIVLYLSYFYTGHELPIRLAFFWISNYLADIISAFMAIAILKMSGIGGYSGWRYLFLLEGFLTLVVGITSWFLMPPGPCQTKAWYRPKGWFTEREEVIMVNRVLRDDPSKSDMHNREGLTFRMIWGALKDWRLWPIYALGLVHMMPVGPPQLYLTLSLRNLGFNTTETNLLTIPSVVIGMTMLIFTAYFSEVVNSRVAATIILQLWALPLLIVLYTFDKSTSQWAYFAVVTLITGFPYVHPIQVAWASRNSYSVRTRTVSASVYNMFVQAGAIVYANIYRQDDKPLYKRGNRVLIGICSMNIFLYIFAFVFYRILNARRDQIWNSMTLEQRQEYMINAKDSGNKRLDFRFVY